MPVKHLIASVFDEFIAKGTSVVDFYTEWCGPCKMLSPIMDELSNEFKDINFGKINVDEASDIASKYNVQSIPTVYLFKDGQIKNKFTGFLPKELVIKFLKSN